MSENQPDPHPELHTPPQNPYQLQEAEQEQEGDAQQAPEPPSGEIQPLNIVPLDPDSDIEEEEEEEDEEEEEKEEEEEEEERR